jgi:hypothetical protein
VICLIRTSLSAPFYCSSVQCWLFPKKLQKSLSSRRVTDVILVFIFCIAEFLLIKSESLVIELIIQTVIGILTSNGCFAHRF